MRGKWNGFTILAATFFAASFGLAQTADSTQSAPPATPEKPLSQQRVLGIIPNYRTIDASEPFSRISGREKFTIAVKDTVDYPVFLLAAGFAGLYQLENQNPSFGQGVKGYAKRFGAAYGDQAIGNLLGEGLVPTLVHQDPRYYRLGPSGGNAWHRTEYALSRILLARNDHGSWTFNVGEWAGNGAAVALSNVYYPEDTRNARDNAKKMVVQIGIDAFSNVLKEFWPDWKRELRHN